MHQTIAPQMLYYGFPVLLLSTIDADGATNLTPVSSSWVLAGRAVLGLGTSGKAFENLTESKEAVLNIAEAGLWPQIEQIARLSGKHSLTPAKEALGYEYCADKFQAASLTPIRSLRVAPHGVEECPLILECLLEQTWLRDGFAILEFKVELVRCRESLVVEGNYIDPGQWDPLIYSFRSYHGLGPSLGSNFRGSK